MHACARTEVLRLTHGPRPALFSQHRRCRQTCFLYALELPRCLRVALQCPNTCPRYCTHTQADVVNRGLSGYNTRWAVHTLPHVFGPAAAPQPAAIATEPAVDGTAVPNGTGKGKGGGGGGADDDGSAPPAGAATGLGHVLFATLFFGANDAARLEGPT